MQHSNWLIACLVTCVVTFGCNEKKQSLSDSLCKESDFEIAFTPLIIGVKAKEAQLPGVLNIPSYACFSTNLLNEVSPLNGLNLTKPWTIRKEKDRHAYHMIIPLFDHKAWKTCVENDLKSKVTEKGDWKTCTLDQFCESLTLFWDNSTLVVCVGDSIHFSKTPSEANPVSLDSDISIKVSSNYIRSLEKLTDRKLPAIKKIVANISFKKGQIDIDLQTPLLDSTETNKWFIHEGTIAAPLSTNTPYLSITNAIKLEALDDFLGHDQTNLFEGLHSFGFIANGFETKNKTVISYDYDDDFNPIEIKKTTVTHHPNIDLLISTNDNYSGNLLSELTNSGFLSKNRNGAYEALLINQAVVEENKDYIRLSTTESKSAEVQFGPNRLFFELHCVLPNSSNKSYAPFIKLLNWSKAPFLCESIKRLDIETTKELNTSLSMQFRDSQANGLSQFMELFQQMNPSREIVMK